VRSSPLPALTTIRQAILHSDIDIMAVVADVMAAMDKAGCSRPVRHPLCRDSKNGAFE
jgi:hypothetical protein